MRWPISCASSASTSTTHLDPTPGRPHLAKALLAAMGPGEAPLNEIFTSYLFPGTPTYVGALPADGLRGDRSDPRRRRARGLGAPVLGRRRGRPTLTEFATYGLDGVEAFYVTHTEAQTRELYAAARERGLLTTGSTDFHGPEHDRFNRFLGFELYGLEPDLGAIAA